MVSPHCDDAVLSLGATIAAHTRGGGSATVVTPLAGDPTSVAAPGPWDAAAGFATEGAAATTRQAEDVEACRLVGARTHHLFDVDEQYPRRLDDDQASAALAPFLEDADEVLLPGFPLRHADHAAVTTLALRALPPDRLVRLYVEEPYALRERLADQPAVDPWTPPLRWGPVKGSRRGVVSKLRAVRRYRSQLVLLSDPSPHRRLGVRPAVLLLELLRTTASRGEWVSEPVPAERLTAAPRFEARPG
ncbi:N-acetylglucosaminyl deacetylase, LmbE family [Geodermatophilus africanus]|uniref:N-acetylglucosaminyl deacetylase, LmbE family n=1 Tax=Geodermatophilus africanus TaxID=1137993 RepID=A0A1H3Q6N6_9ACTN|nr:PIG-L family deacetylase [Geodermatophilus africanus]SDZ09182.1 N-acetylglucosaminyl deacetylase, LmbE family [Geodermatophilus africanus]